MSAYLNALSEQSDPKVLFEHIVRLKAEHDARVSELLAANNAEVERRRAAERVRDEALAAGRRAGIDEKAKLESVRDEKLSDRERTVLVDMLNSGAAENYAVFFRGLTMHDEKIPEIRRTVRKLARKGLARYIRGIFTEDGTVGGSGYGLTAAGTARAEAERAKMMDGGRC
jgi:hypothetical protein